MKQNTCIERERESEREGERECREEREFTPHSILTYEIHNFTNNHSSFTMHVQGYLYPKSWLLGITSSITKSHLSHIRIQL